MPLEENTLVFTMFVQHQGRKSSKTPLFRLIFSGCVENTVFFLRCLLTRAYKYIVNTGVHFTFISSNSQSKPAKNTGICCVLTSCFETIFYIFQFVLLNSENNHFWLCFCHHSSGLKKALNRKILPNCT